MGCDIHVFAEKNVGGIFEKIEMPYGWFDSRSYGRFGFLANVRNYSGVVPFGQTEVPEKYKPIGRGIPADVSDDVKSEFDDWETDAHSESWLSLEELLAFDYEQVMEDRRVTRNNDGGCTCEPGEGRKMTYREFLGPNFFDELQQAKSKGADRIVFWFDN